MLLFVPRNCRVFRRLRTGLFGEYPSSDASNYATASEHRALILCV